MKIAIGSDHAGYDYKTHLIEKLEEWGHDYVNYGTNSSDSVDYPDFAHPVAKAVGSDDVEMGILICGSANGVAISANKHQHVRAAICWEKDIAELARLHNNANIICIPARFISKRKAVSLLKIFLSTNFESGRHERRVNKMPIGC